MMKTIKVYGKLAKFLGRRVFKADVSSAAEAVRFLVANYPELHSHMREQYYRVRVGSHPLTSEELHHPTGMQVIRIAPVLAGAGSNGGLSQILIGAALIGLSFVSFGAGTAFAGMGAAFSGAAAGFGSTALFSIGASLVLGGVAQLISPVPAIPTGKDSEQDPRKTYSFSGIQQTSRQGIPVPIVYGETIVGSIVISAGIDTEKVSV